VPLGRRSPFGDCRTRDLDIYAVPSVQKMTVAKMTLLMPKFPKFLGDCRGWQPSPKTSPHVDTDVRRSCASVDRRRRLTVTPVGRLRPSMAVQHLLGPGATVDIRPSVLRSSRATTRCIVILKNNHRHAVNPRKRPSMADHQPSTLERRTSSDERRAMNVEACHS